MEAVGAIGMGVEGAVVMEAVGAISVEAVGAVGVEAVGAVGMEVGRAVGVLVAGVSLPQPASRTAAIDTHKTKGSHLDMPVRVIITPLDVPRLRSVSRVENNR